MLQMAPRKSCLHWFGMFTSWICSHGQRLWDSRAHNIANKCWLTLLLLHCLLKLMFRFDCVQCAGHTSGEDVRCKGATFYAYALVSRSQPQRSQRQCHWQNSICLKCFALPFVHQHGARAIVTQTSRLTMFKQRVESWLSQPRHSALTIKWCGQRFPFTITSTFPIFKILFGHLPKIHLVPLPDEFNWRTEAIATITQHFRS